MRKKAVGVLSNKLILYWFVRPQKTVLICTNPIFLEKNTRKITLKCHWYPVDYDNVSVLDDKK